MVNRAMRRAFHRLVRVLLPIAVAVSVPLVSSHPASANYVPWGTVLVSGSAWAGAYAQLGDLNVYSNGDGNEDVWGPYGMEFECFELAARWAQIAYGDPHNGWNAYYAYQMYDTGPRQSPAFIQEPNGGAQMPQFGDLLIFDHTSTDAAGHVAVVSGVGSGYVDIVEQNWANYNPTGQARLPIGGFLNGSFDPTYMPPRWGLPIRGWLRSVVAPGMAVGTANDLGWQLKPGKAPQITGVPHAGAAPAPGTPARGMATPTPAPAGSALPPAGKAGDAFNQPTSPPPSATPGPTPAAGGASLAPGASPAPASSSSPDQYVIPAAPPGANPPVYFPPGTRGAPVPVSTAPVSVAAAGTQSAPPSSALGADDYIRFRNRYARIF